MIHFTFVTSNENRFFLAKKCNILVNFCIETVGNHNLKTFGFTSKLVLKQFALDRISRVLKNTKYASEPNSVTASIISGLLVELQICLNHNMGFALKKPVYCSGLEYKTIQIVFGLSFTGVNYIFLIKIFRVIITIYHHIVNKSIVN